MSTSETSDVDIELKIDAMILMIATADQVEVVNDWYEAYELACSLAVCYRKGYVTGLSPEGIAVLENAFREFHEQTGISEERLIEMTVGA
jgi:uncharacterized membrane protein